MNRLPLLRRLVASVLLLVLIVELSPTPRPAVHTSQQSPNAMVTEPVAHLRAWYARTTARMTARGQMEQAWQRARNAGGYDFTADVTQRIVPLPTIRNVGLQSKETRLHLEGSTNLPQRNMEFVVWAQGGSVLDLDSGLAMRIEDGQTFVRKGAGDWEEQEGMADAFAPGSDFMIYLQAAKNVVRHEPESRFVPIADAAWRFTRFTFDLDGPTFARHVRDQMQQQLKARGELPPGLHLDLPQVYAKMEGKGELWVDGNGLPLRQILWIEYPEQDDQRVSAEITVDFSGFGDGADDGLRLAQAPAQLLSLSASALRRSAEGGLALAGTLIFTAGLVRGGRRRWVYRIIVALMIVSMMGVPLLQATQVAAFYDRQTERAGSEIEGRADGAAPLAEHQPSTQTAPVADHPASQAVESPAAAAALAARAANLPDPPPDDGTDSDNDGLTDYAEHVLGTDPNAADTDGDSISDRQEVEGFTFNGQQWHADPSSMDTNNDGIADSVEWTSRDDPGAIADTDGDGVPDLFDLDNDGDGVPDRFDLSPHQATNSTIFNRARPFSFVLDDLRPGRPTFVEFQVRPTDPDHLWYALNVLDWPDGDRRGQIQDDDGATFFDVDGSTTRLPNDNGDLKLIPMLEIVIATDPGAPQTHLPPTEELEPYGISVKNLDESGAQKVAYVPLQLVNDDSGARVAFHARMLYHPEGEWGNAHQARLVWVLQALVDVCQHIENNQCVDYEDQRNEVRVIQTYDDEWQLTGFALREDHGVEFAIVHEDPEVDPDPQDDAALAALSYGLDHSFQAARIDSDGDRSFTVDTLAQRFDRTTNSSVPEEQRWSIPNILRVTRHSYETMDKAMISMATKDSQTVLDAFPTDLVPTLLFAWEEQFRAMNLDADANVTWKQNGDNTTLAVSFANEQVTTVAGVNWAPYRHNGAGWEAYPIDEYLQLLEHRYFNTFTDADETIRRGQMLIAQFYYLALYSGVINVVAVGDLIQPDAVFALPDPQIQDVIVENVVRLSGEVVGKALAFLVSKKLTDPKALSSALGKSYAQGLGSFDDLAQPSIGDFGALNRIKRNLTGGSLATKVTTVAVIGVAVAGLLAGGAVLLAGKLTDDSTLQFVGTALITGFLTALQIIKPLISIVQTIRFLVQSGQSIVSATTTVLKASSTLVGSGKVAGVVGAVIGLIVIWGIFLYQVLSNELEPGSVAFNMLLATTIAASIVLIVLIVISAVNVVGFILVTLIGLVDFILLLAGVDFSVAGWVTKELTEVIYKFDTIIEIDEDASGVGQIDMEMVDPNIGMRVGNRLTFSTQVTTTVQHYVSSNIDYGCATKPFFDDDTLRDTTVRYTLSQTPKDVSVDSGQMRNDWRGVHRFDEDEIICINPDVDLYRGWTVQDVVATININVPGVNAATPLYLNTGYSIPAVECWYVTCDSESVEDSTSVFLGDDLRLDFLPATLDGFYAWAQTAFDQHLDYDGDGLRAGAYGGNDPDDTTWDKDGDGLPDSFEMELRARGIAINPTLSDTDKDGLCDWQEIFYGTDADRADTDGDGLYDSEEVFHQDLCGAGTGDWIGGLLFQYDVDADANPLTTRINTDPRRADSDGDGISDLAERNLHQIEPQVYALNPNVFNKGPGGLYVELGDEDGVVKPGMTVPYTATMIDNFPPYSVLGALTVTVPPPLVPDGVYVDPFNLAPYDPARPDENVSRIGPLDINVPNVDSQAVSIDSDMFSQFHEGNIEYIWLWSPRQEVHPAQTPAFNPTPEPHQNDFYPYHTAIAPVPPAADGAEIHPPYLVVSADGEIDYPESGGNDGRSASLGQVVVYQANGELGLFDPVKVSDLFHFDSSIPEPPAAACADNGHCMVAWVRRNEDSTNPVKQVSAAVVSAGSTTSVVASEFEVTVGARQHRPAVATDGEKFLVIWYNWAEDMISASLFDNDGSALTLFGGETVGYARPFTGAGLADVAWIGDRYQVVWEQVPDDPSDGSIDIWTNTVNAMGEPGKKQPLIEGTADEFRPQLAHDPISGRTLLVYQSDSDENGLVCGVAPASGNGTAVCGRFLNDPLNPDSFLIAQPRSGETVAEAHVTWDARNEGWLVTWGTADGDGRHRVRYRALEPDGAIRGRQQIFTWSSDRRIQRPFDVACRYPDAVSSDLISNCSIVANARPPQLTPLENIPANSRNIYLNQLFLREVSPFRGSLAQQRPTPITIDNEAPSATFEHTHWHLPATGATIVVGGGASDPSSYVTDVSVSVDGGAWESAEGQGSWAYAWEVPPGQAAHQALVRATDAVGHVQGTPGQAYIVADGTPPQISTTLAPNAIVGASLNSEGLWEVRLTDAFVVSDPTVSGQPGSGVAVVEVMMTPDGNGWQRAEHAGGNTWTIDYVLPAFGDDNQAAVNPTDKTFTVRVRAVDNVGNQTPGSQIAETNVRIDATPPEMSLTALGDFDPATTEVITQTWPLGLTGVISETGAARAGVQSGEISFTPVDLLYSSTPMAVNNFDWQAVTLAEAGRDVLTSTWTLPTPLGFQTEGFFRVDARGTDAVGNRNDNQSRWTQWTGEVDITYPRVRVRVSYSGAGSTARTRYEMEAEDLNLVEEGFVFPCAVEPEDREYYHSGWWDEWIADPTRLYRLTPACEIPGLNLDPFSINVCDAFGRCTGAEIVPETQIYWTEPYAINRTDAEDEQVEQVGAWPHTMRRLRVDTENGKIYWLNNPSGTSLNGIQRANLDGSEIETIAVGTILHLVAVDGDSNAIYWVEEEAGNYVLYRAHLDGSDPTAILTRPASNFARDQQTAFAIDLRDGRIYWAEDDKILRTNADGSVTTLLTGQADIDVSFKLRPRWLFVDPVDDHLYWIMDEIEEGNTNATLELRRANIDDGTELQNLALLNFDLRDATLDVDGRGFYFAANVVFGGADIVRTDLDGSNQKVIDTSFSASAVDVGGGHLYLSGFTGGQGTTPIYTLYRMDADGNNATPLRTELTFTTEEKHAIDLADEGTVYLGMENRGVARFYPNGWGDVPVNDESILGPLLIDVANDRLYTLERNDSSHFVIGERTLEGNPLDPLTPFYLESSSNGPVTDIAIRDEDAFYYTSSPNGDGYVYRKIRVQGGFHSRELAKQPGTADGLAVDLSEGYAYWTNRQQGELWRTSLDGSESITLVSGLNEPTWVELAPALGRIFWVERDGADRYQIRSANLDGTDVSTFQSGLRTRPALASILNLRPYAGETRVEVAADATSNLTLNGFDADGDSLTYAIVDPPAHGSLGGTPPNVTYTPDSGYTGLDSFTYRIEDGRGGEAVGTVVIGVVESQAGASGEIGVLGVGVLAQVTTQSSTSNLTINDTALEDYEPPLDKYTPSEVDVFIRSLANGDTITSTMPISITGNAYASAGLQNLTLTANGDLIHSQNWSSGESDDRWSTTWTPTEGRVTLVATLTDKNGTPASHTIELIVDTIAPTLTMTATELGDGDASGYARVNLTGMVEDAGGLANVDVRVDGGSWRAAGFDPTSDDQYAWRYLWDVDGNLDGKVYSVEARAIDVAGHTAIVTQTVGVDLVKPAPVTVTLSYNGAPIQPGDTVRAASADLTIEWTESHDASGLDDYRVGWSEDPIPDPDALTAYTPTATRSHTQSIDQARPVYAHVVAQDGYGNQQIATLGPVYVDAPETPNYLADLTYAGWMDDSCNVIGIDRAILHSSGEFAALHHPQKLYAAWDASTLRLTWLGADWDSDGDLFLYLDTGTGGTQQAHNPYGAGPDVILPGDVNASHLVWVQDNDSASLLSWNGSAWTVQSESLEIHHELRATHINLQRSQLGNPTALDLVGFASEEGALRLWAIAPDENPHNSTRVTNPLAAPYLENDLTLLHSLSLGPLDDRCPKQGAFVDADLRVSLSADASATIAGYREHDLLDLLTPGAALDPNLALPLDVVPFPLRTGQVVNYTLIYTNTGTDTAPSVAVDVAGQGALSPNQNMLILGDVAGGASGSVNFSATAGGSGAPALNLTVRQDGEAFDWLWAQHDLDAAPPGDLAILAPLDYVRPGVNVVHGTATDPSGVANVTLEVQPVGGSAVQIGCPDSDPRDGLWTCPWDPGDLDGVDAFLLRIRATDGLGNQSGWTGAVQVPVDTTPPTVTLDYNMGLLLEEGVLDPGTLRLEGEAFDDHEARTVEVCLRSQSTESCADTAVAPGNAITGTWSHVLDLVDTGGLTQTLTLVAVDAVGNHSTEPITYSFTVDGQAPVLTVSQVLTEALLGDYWAYAPRALQASAVLTGSIEDVGGVGDLYVRATLPDGRLQWHPLSTTPISGTDGAQWQFVPRLHAPGTYEYTVTAYDRAGNAANSGSYTFEAVEEPIGGLTVQALPSSVTIGGSTRLQAETTSGGNITYTWDLGDGTPPVNTGPLNYVDHVYAAIGDYTVAVTATNSVNKQSASTVTMVRDVAVASPLLAEDFEEDFPPAGWQRYSLTDETQPWQPTADPSYAGTVAALHSGGTGAQDAWLVTPLTDLGNGSRLIFWQHQIDADAYERHSVLVSTGSPDPADEEYVEVKDLGPGGEGTWEEVVVDLSAYDGQSVYIAFRYRGEDADQWAIDEVRVDTALTAFADDPTVLGKTTTLTATVATGTNIVYTWDLGDGTVLPDRGSGFSDGVAHTYADPGTYTVRVRASNSTNSVTATTTVVVDAPVAGLSVTNNGPTPLGSATAFQATKAAGSNLRYTWNFGDGSRPYTIRFPNTNHKYPSTGTFTTIVTAANSVSSATATTVVVVDEAIAGLAATNDGPTALDGETTLSASVAAGSNVRYTWDAGDGSPPVSGQTITHTYAAVGTYTATVTATNSVGTVTATTVVVVQDRAIGAPLLAENFDGDFQFVLNPDARSALRSGDPAPKVWAIYARPGKGDPWERTTQHARSPEYSIFHGGTPGPNDAWLVTPPITPTLASHLIFWQSVRSPERIAGHSVWVSTGSPDPEMGDYVLLAEAAPTAAGEWQMVDLDLGLYADQPVYLAFRYEGSNAAEWYVDDLVVTADLHLTSDSPRLLGETTTFTATVIGGSNVVYHWDFGDGATITSTLPVITHTYAAGGFYTAQVTAQNSRNAVSATTTVAVVSADLTIDKTTSPHPATAGAPLTYTLTVANDGPAAASNLVVTDVLPAGVHLLDAPDCAQGSGAITCAIAQLGAGEQVSRTLRVRVDPGQREALVNMATVSAAEPDERPLNNTVTTTTTVTAAADLAIRKMVTPTVAAPGDAVTYTLVFSNRGPSTATEVLIMDETPPAVRETGVLTGDAPILGTGAPPVRWRMADLAPGTAGTITVTGVLTDDVALYGTHVVNRAAITAAEDDPVADDNETAAMVAIVDAPALLVEKSAHPASGVAPGSVLTYTVVVRNPNTVAISGVRLTDTLPAAVDFGHWIEQPPGAVRTGGAITWQGDVSAGRTITATYAVTHTGGFGDVLTNTVRFEHPTGRGTVVNVVRVLGPPVLAIEKRVDDPTPDEGSTFTYQVVVTNSGESTATNVWIRDSLAGTLASAIDLDAGAQISYTYPHLVSDGPARLTNTATVTSWETPAPAMARVKVSVRNVPPAVEADAAQITAAGTTVTLAAVTFTDPGADSHTATIDWGDGTIAAGVVDERTVRGEHVYQSDGVYDVTICVDDDDGGEGCDAIRITVGAVRTLYLPTLLQQDIDPDLVVAQIVASPDVVQVVIVNQGDAPVVDAFWVDLYVDPLAPPTAVNQTWPALAAQGMVWGVTGLALPLAPGERLVLTAGDGYYWPDLSAIDGPLPLDTPIYAQVDSANAETDYGAVLEIHERRGEPYNNVTGPMLVVEAVTPLRAPALTPAQSTADARRALPSRPRQTPSPLWLPWIEQE